MSVEVQSTGDNGITLNAYAASSTPHCASEVWYELSAPRLRFEPTRAPAAMLPSIVNSSLKQGEGTGVRGG